MWQMQVESSLVLALALTCCLSFESGRAANVGRQRRVQTSATSTGPAQAAVFGVPLWHTTFNSNDEYIETPLGRPAGQRAAYAQLQQLQQQQQQQAKNLAGNIYAEEQRGNQELEADYGELLPAAELTPAQVQQLVLFGSPSTQLVSRGSEQGESRLFRLFKHKHNMSDPHEKYHHHNVTTVNINNNNVTNVVPTAATTTTTTTTTTAAPATGTRIIASGLYRGPQFLPQYFETRQGQNGALGQDVGLGLPYDLIDVNAADLYGGGLVLGNGAFAGAGINGINGINGLPGLGGGVSLVPVTLGNNAVGYVPLNMRVYRQLATGNSPALPIREGEDDATPEAEPESEHEPESSDPIDEAPLNKNAATRFPLFGQRLRQRPGLSAASAAGVGERYPMRNPLMAFAKNIRRVQYL